MELLRRLALEGLVSEEEYTAVVARRAVLSEPAPIALTALRIASEEAVQSLLDRLGFAPATRLRPSPMAKSLPKGLLRAFWALPIGESPIGIVVAMVDPTDAHALRELSFHLRRPIDPRTATASALREILLQIDPPKPVTEPPPAIRPELLAHSSAERKGQSSTSAWSAPKKNQLPRDVLALGAQVPNRRLTPAYGQKAPSDGDGSSWGVAAKTVKNQLTKLGSTVGLATTPAPPQSTPHRDTLRPGVAPAAKTQPPAAPAKRKSVAPSAPPPAVPGSKSIPREALFALGEMQTTSDRDEIARIATKGMTSIAQRSAFFVVKRGVIQGWEGAVAPGVSAGGVSREALRNLWIPITSPSVFRRVSEQGGVYIGPLGEATADSILAAALGHRPAKVLVAGVHIQGHTVAFLYADGIGDPIEAEERTIMIVDAAGDAFARWLAQTRSR